MLTFSLSYDVVTPESAESGDCAEFGFMMEPTELRRGELRRAIKMAMASGCSAPDSQPADYSRGRASFYGPDGSVNYRTGAVTNYCAHFSGATPSTLARIARLLARCAGCGEYGC